LIIALRQRHLLTQEELARRTGVSRAQLARYERGLSEPTVSTLRRLLEPMGWAPTFGLEPTTAVLDEQFERGYRPRELLSPELVRVLETVGLAAAAGIGVVAGGEAAAVLQGVPQHTDDMVLHLLSQDREEFARLALERVQGLLPTRDENEWQLWVGGNGVYVRTRLVESLPANRIVELDFAPWLEQRSVPVVNLDTLLESGELGPSSVALVERLLALTCTESIT
jgi:transcriptional regulator with XRE-family HTH domain